MPARFWRVFFSSRTRIQLIPIVLLFVAAYQFMHTPENLHLARKVSRISTLVTTKCKYGNLTTANASIGKLIHEVWDCLRVSGAATAEQVKYVGRERTNAASDIADQISNASLHNNRTSGPQFIDPNEAATIEPNMSKLQQNVATSSNGAEIHDEVNSLSRHKPAAQEHKGRLMTRGLLFTMDSLRDGVLASTTGGPSGEIVVRTALEEALNEIGIRLDIADSDAMFEDSMQVKPLPYQFVILDPWTWSDPEGRLKPFLLGLESKIFIMEFFGDTNVPIFPPERVLTAYPMSDASTTFLGWAAEPAVITSPKKRLGVIWGKQSIYFASAWPIIEALAALSPVHLTIPFEEGFLQHENVTYRGFLSKSDWLDLLVQSRYLAGMGHPIAGPSAMDAVSAGCVYINPTFAYPERASYLNQHPFLSALGPPTVCNVMIENVNEYVECARAALDVIEIKPLVVEPYTRKSHRQRVAQIFGGFVSGERLDASTVAG